MVAESVAFLKSVKFFLDMTILPYNYGVLLSA